MALDNYIDYLRLGVPSKEIDSIILECCNDADDIFSPEAFAFSKKYLGKGFDFKFTGYTLAYAKDNDGYIKTEVFEPLLELVDNVQKFSKKKSLYFSLTLLKNLQNEDKDKTAQVLRIVNKIVKSGATPETSLNYLNDFEGREGFLEEIVDYSINTQIPMYKLKRHSFQSKKESHQLIYSTMMKQQKPFFSIQLMVEDLPIWEDIDEALSGLNDFLTKNPDFPVELLRVLVDRMIVEAWQIQNENYAICTLNPEVRKEYDATSIVYRFYTNRNDKVKQNKNIFSKYEIKEMDRRSKEEKSILCKDVLKELNFKINFSPKNASRDFILKTNLSSMRRKFF